MRDKQPTEIIAEELHGKLRLGEYNECYDEIKSNRRIVEYLPPTYFRELAINLYQSKKYEALDLISIMLDNYPTLEETTNWLPKPTVSRSNTP